MEYDGRFNLFVIGLSNWSVCDTGYEIIKMNGLITIFIIYFTVPVSRNYSLLVFKNLKPPRRLHQS